MIEQNETDVKIYDEYQKFKVAFDRQVDLHAKLKQRVRTFRDFMYKDVPKYIGDKLMPVMFSNLTKTHTDMFPIPENDNYLFVATPKGIRKKYQHSVHTDELTLKELHTICNDKFMEAEAWFKANLKQKRVMVLNQFKEAFNQGFNSEWLQKKDKEVTFEVPVDRDIWYIANDREESRLVNIKHFRIKSVVALINVTDGEIDIVFTTDKYEPMSVKSSYWKRNEYDKYIYFNPESFFPMFSFRHALPELNMLIDKVNAYYDGEEQKVEAWYGGFKQKLSIYVSLINL